MHNPLKLTFGVLGNITSFMAFIAPVSTFYIIFKKKSTAGFHCVPYIVALLSSMLWLFYGFIQKNETLLLTINSFGCFIETIYIILFIVYANKTARLSTLKLLFLTLSAFGLVVLTNFLLKVSHRGTVLGWICMTFSVAVFVAPLSIMRKVIRTKSVEFMPVALSITLLLSAVMWFFYGFFLKNFYIMVPNIVGFLLALVQIILYLMYKNRKTDENVQHEQRNNSPNGNNSASSRSTRGTGNLEISIG